MFSVPAIPISMLCLCLAGSSWSWYSASLEPFLAEEYLLTPAQTGLIFLIFGFCYTVFTPITGFFVDHGLDGLTAMSVGNFAIMLGFIFLGPIPPLEAIRGNLWLTALSVGKKPLRNFEQLLFSCLCSKVTYMPNAKCLC